MSETDTYLVLVEELREGVWQQVDSHTANTTTAHIHVDGYIQFRVSITGSNSDNFWSDASSLVDMAPVIRKYYGWGST